MARLAWCLVILTMVGLAMALMPQAAAAQGGGSYANVSGLKPFTAESNYMSLPGYLRWMTYTEQQVWLSVPEAKRIVAEQTGG